MSVKKSAPPVPKGSMTLVEEIKATRKAVDLKRKEEIRAMMRETRDDIYYHLQHANALKPFGSDSISIEPHTIPKASGPGAVSFSFGKGESVSVMASQMPYVRPLPPYITWVHLRTNHRVEDDAVLKYIPYFGDDDNGNIVDISLYEEETVTAAHNASAERLDRSVVDRRVIQEVVASRGAHPEVLEALDGVLGCPPGTAAQACKERSATARQREERAARAAARGEKDAPPSKEVLMESYRALFCRRCYIYDCRLHGCHRMEKQRREPEGVASAGPCGPSCHVAAAAKPAPPAKRACGDDGFVGSGPKHRWTPLEKAMFERARETFGKDYCSIAMLVPSVTCQQVYEYAFSIYGEDVEQKEEAEQAPKAKKKRVGTKAKATALRRITSSSGVKAKNEGRSLEEYTPCSHGDDAGAGACGDPDGCACAASGNFCEKFCGCPADCPNRFPGCVCGKSRCQTRMCPCFAAHRECDPDLCIKCGAVGGACKNAGLQALETQDLLVGISSVAGWGVFLKSAVEKNDLIAEYMGEVISQAEAERRGKIYDKQMCSFLFNLNEDLVIDAARKGNKIKFANHSANPNCYAKILMVNGDHRIGIYAKEAINAGDELFFDYRYGPEGEKYVPWERDFDFSDSGS